MRIRVTLKFIHISFLEDTFWYGGKMFKKLKGIYRKILRLFLELLNQFGLFADPDGELLELFIFLLK